MVRTTLLTLVMLLIWQTNLMLVFSFPLIFGSVELIYMSLSYQNSLKVIGFHLLLQPFSLNVHKYIKIQKVKLRT